MMIIMLLIAGWFSGVRAAVDSVPGEVCRLGPTDKRLWPALNAQGTRIGRWTANCRSLSCVSSK